MPRYLKLVINFLLANLLLSAIFCMPDIATTGYRINYGTWRRPQSSDSRSPCPALNSLANHGLISHSGKGIKKQELYDALIKYYNLSPRVAWGLVTPVYFKLGKKGLLDLADLQLHGFIEHDVSLVHQDTAIGVNWIPDNNLVKQLIDITEGEEPLTAKDLAKARLVRYQQCKTSNEQLQFGTKQKLFSDFELALILQVFGGKEGQGKEVSKQNIMDFLLQEKFPYYYVRPEKPVGLPDLWRTRSEIRKAEKEILAGK